MPDAVGETLTQRAGCDFDTDGVTELGMSRSFAPPLAEVFNLLHRQVKTEQMQQRIEQH